METFNSRCIPDNAYACDPRIRRYKEAEKAEKLARKRQREEALRMEAEVREKERQERLEEERKKAELEEEDARLRVRWAGEWVWRVVDALVLFPRPNRPRRRGT